MNAPLEVGHNLGVVARQAEVVEALRRVVPAHCVLYREEQTRPYECDGLALFRQLPNGVPGAARLLLNLISGTPPGAARID